MAYALHRQVPYGVPGAYRILANLISDSAGTDMQAARVLCCRPRYGGSRHRLRRAQTPVPAPHHVVAVPLQPFAVLARRVETALEYLGQPLAVADRQALAAALANTDDHAGVTAATAILDRYALVHVHINPESRVKVTQGQRRRRWCRPARACSW